jgi:hypothetical protein
LYFVPAGGNAGNIECSLIVRGGGKNGAAIQISCGYRGSGYGGAIGIKDRSDYGPGHFLRPSEGGQQKQGRQQ